MYHLPLARLYAEKHFIQYTPYTRYSFAPQANEMLFSLVFLLKLSPIFAQVIEFSLFLLVLLGTYLIGKKYFYNRFVGLMGVAILASTTSILQAATTAYIDLWGVLYTLGAILLLPLTKKRDITQLKWVILVSIYLALSADGKYTGIVVAIVLFLVWQLQYRPSLKTSILAILTFVSLIFPWYFRTYILTGDPFYPMATSIFGNSGVWTNTLIQDQISNFSTTGSIVKQIYFNFILIFKSYILGAQTNFFTVENIIVGVFIVLGLFNKSIWRVKSRRYLYLFVLLYCLIWAKESFIIRYGMPIFPIISLTAAYGINHTYKLFFKKTIYKYKKLHLIFSFFLIFILLWGGIQYELQMYSINGVLPMNNKQQTSFLDRNLPTYSVYNYLNHSHPNSVVYSLENENMNFYYNGTWIGDWFGKGSYFHIFGNDLKPFSVESLYKSLKKLNTKFLVLDTPASYIYNMKNFNKYFKIIYISPNARVYRLN
jgi:hypothetical protein